MSTPIPVERRPVPEILRVIADQLTAPITEAERLGIAVTLRMAADQLDPNPGTTGGHCGGGVLGSVP